MALCKLEHVCRSKRQHSTARLVGMKIGIALVMVFLSSPVKAQSKNARTPSDQRFEQCRAKLKKAKALDVLYDMDWKSPMEPRIVVGPTFFTMAIDGKEGFVNTVNCFLTAGQTDKCVNFSVLDWRTGKPVGRYSGCSFALN